MDSNTTERLPAVALAYLLARLLNPELANKMENGDYKGDGISKSDVEVVMKRLQAFSEQATSRTLYDQLVSLSGKIGLKQGGPWDPNCYPIESAKEILKVTIP